MIKRALRRLFRWRHPILSRFPELIEAPGAKWCSMSELAGPGFESHQCRPLLDKWFLVSIGYTEAIAKENGIQKERMKMFKDRLRASLEAAVRETCLGE